MLSPNDYKAHEAKTEGKNEPTQLFSRALLDIFQTNG